MDGNGAGPVPSRGWRLAVGGGAAAAFLAVDQVTKALVRDAVAAGPFGGELVPGVLRLQFVANRGASFGIGQGMGAAFAALAVAVVIAVCVYLRRAPAVSRLEVAGLGMLAGGAVGNALDRVLLGYVTDFFATEFIDFPVFNVADIGVTVGVALALVGFMVLSPANARAGARERL